jgi:hypothetical protein
MTQTLETMRPVNAARPIHVTAEYGGKRYLIADVRDGWIVAEDVAMDFVAAFPDARFYTGDVYGSQSINGRTKEFKLAYKGGK